MSNEQYVSFETAQQAVEAAVEIAEMLERRLRQ